MPLHRLNRDQSGSSSVPTSPSQNEEEEEKEDEEDHEVCQVWLSKEDPAQEEQEEEQQEEEEEDLPGQRPCANPGHGPVPTLGYQLVSNRPQDELSLIHI